MFTTQQLQAVHEAIRDAFSPDEFDRLLRTELGLRTELISGRGKPFEHIVYEVIQQAERAGWTGELMQAVYKARPRRPDLAALYQDLGFTPEAGVLGDVPTPDGGSDRGFEKAVRSAPMQYFSLWREQMTAIEGRVCKVEINGEPISTGFLVGPDVVLTCYHSVEEVITSSQPPSTVGLRFDVRIRNTDAVEEGFVVGLSPTDWLIDASPYAEAERRNEPDSQLPTVDQLDYALLRLTRPLGLEPLDPDAPSSPVRGWIRVPAADPAIQPDESLAVVQHGRGGPLRIAFGSHAVIGFNANRTRLRYTIETERGSAGAPCFDTTWNLVAVHHYRQPGYVAGTPYRQGIPIAAIAERLRRMGKASFLGGEVPSGAFEAVPSQLRDIKPPEPGPVVHPRDPQKERWGGKSERNGRRVSVELLDTSGRVFSFNAVAESTDGTPLEGPVLFHLHDTYPKSVIWIRKVREGKKAVLEEVTSYGVFTIGVQVKDARGEWVGLEYDLTQDTELPGRFRYE